MDSVIEFLSRPWPWYVAGPLIAIVMVLLIYFGNNFGISANFRTICSMTGGGKTCDFFVELAAYGIENPGENILPQSIFSWESLLSVKGLIILVIGGFLVGFGTHYAGGCTSAHAISGLSDLQLPSLIAVIGFFILMHSMLAHLFDYSEKVFPSLIPAALVDEKPAMRPIQHDTFRESK